MSLHALTYQESTILVFQTAERQRATGSDPRRSVIRLLDMPKVCARRVFHAGINERGQPNQTDFAITLPSCSQKLGSYGGYALCNLIRVFVRVDVFRSPYKIKIIHVLVLIHKEVSEEAGSCHFNWGILALFSHASSVLR